MIDAVINIYLFLFGCGGGESVKPLGVERENSVLQT
jgi:hypothetical protein